MKSKNHTRFAPKKEMNNCQVNSECMLACSTGRGNVEYISELDKLPEDLASTLDQCYQGQKKIIQRKYETTDDATIDKPCANECEENKAQRNAFLTRTNLQSRELELMMKEVLSSIKDARFVKILGEHNNNGHVFLVCNPDISRQQLVVKYISQPLDDFEQEYKALQKFYEAGLAPRPIQISAKKTMFAMGKIDTILGTKLRSRAFKHSELDHILGFVFTLLHKLKVANMTHGDFHWDNIGLVEQDGFSVPILLDTGFSNYLAWEERIDLMQITRTTYDFMVGEENAQYLRPILTKMYEDKYGPYDDSKFLTLDHPDYLDRVDELRYMRRDLRDDIPYAPVSLNLDAPDKKETTEARLGSPIHLTHVSSVENTVIKIEPQDGLLVYDDKVIDKYPGSAVVKQTKLLPLHKGRYDLYHKNGYSNGDSYETKVRINVV